MAKHSWTDPEVNHATTLAGNVPPPLLSLWYNSWASKNGFPPRSQANIIDKLANAGYTISAIGDWITTGYIASSLGLHLITVQRWATRYAHVLEPYQPPARAPGKRLGRCYLRRERVCFFGYLFPQLFGGCNADDLYCVFEDRWLADHIAVTWPDGPGVINGRGRKVRCVETGQVYPSCAAAGKAVFASRSSISYAVHHGTICAGYHWRSEAQT